VTFICNTPVDDGTTRVWTGTMVKAANFPVSEADVKLAREQEAASVHAFSQDFEIWNNKAPAVNILQIPTDGPFDKNRIWYKQFYNPRAKAKDFLSRIEGVHFVRGMPNQSQFKAKAAE
jgi:3-ketosteroid 9alpha-monooxygenase subunit A